MRDVDRSGRLAYYLEHHTPGSEEDFDVDPAEYARTILIGESDGNECILLLPPSGDGDWDLWTYHPELGFSTGFTFEELMRSALEE